MKIRIKKDLSVESKLCMRAFCVLAILFLLAISGCGGGKKSSSLTDADIRKGTDGLTMEFLQNAPPLNVFEGGSFPISLRIKNTGAFDIGDKPNTENIVEQSGIIVLGFEKASVDIKNPRIEVKIAGKSIFNLKGEEDVKSTNAEAKLIGGQSETRPSTIFATACYPYKTIMDASACIDPDVIGQRRGQKACTIKDLDFGDGQGAPLVVTKIETRMLPQQDSGKVKSHFIIHIKNSGNGQVIRREVREEGKEPINILERVCSSEPLSYMKNKDFNTFNVMATLSGVELDCNPEEDIGPGATEARLREKEDMIRCTYVKKDIDGKEGIDADIDAYTAPLKIEMDYGYTFTISKDIIIEKVLTH